MNFQITEYCHHILEEYIEEGDICIDATAGNGGDTEFLCQKVGETGNVYAFDVQEMAIAHTRERLEKANLSARAKLIQDGHEKMQTYVKKEAILNYLKTLDSKKWLVIVNSYFNRKNDPPLPVFIYRLK